MSVLDVFPLNYFKVFFDGLHNCCNFGRKCVVASMKIAFNFENHPRLVDGQLVILFKSLKILTINVPVVYMGRYEVVLRGDYP